MTDINFPVHDQIQELIKDAGFCSCYLFCNDVFVVGKKKNK